MMNEEFQKARIELLGLISQYVDMATPGINLGGNLLQRRLSAVKHWRVAPGHFDCDVLEFEDQLKRVDAVQNEFRAWVHDNREESIESLAKRAGIETSGSRADDRMVEFVTMQIEVRKRKIKYEIPTLEIIVSKLNKSVIELERIVGNNSGD